MSMRERHINASMVFICFRCGTCCYVTHRVDITKKSNLLLKKYFEKEISFIIAASKRVEHDHIRPPELLLESGAMWP